MWVSCLWATVGLTQIYDPVSKIKAKSQHRCPLQCGAACFDSTKEWVNDHASDNLVFTGLSSLSLSESPRLLDTPALSAQPATKCLLLALPGEIRNRIYRYVLLKPKPFAVRLQFSPRDTALLLVNKQVYREASTIFYYENTFRIPESLFLGAPILQQMERFYHVPRWTLKSMKHLVVEIPVSTISQKSLHPP